MLLWQNRRLRTLGLSRHPIQAKIPINEALERYLSHPTPRVFRAHLYFRFGETKSDTFCYFASGR